jgi:hypothetical protein
MSYGGETSRKYYHKFDSGFNAIALILVTLLCLNATIAQQGHKVCKIPDHYVGTKIVPKEVHSLYLNGSFGSTEIIPNSDLSCDNLFKNSFTDEYDFLQKASWNPFAPDCKSYTERKSTAVNILAYYCCHEKISACGKLSSPYQCDITTDIVDPVYIQYDLEFSNIDDAFYWQKLASYLNDRETITQEISQPIRSALQDTFKQHCPYVYHNSYDSLLSVSLSSASISGIHLDSGIYRQIGRASDKPPYCDNKNCDLCSTAQDCNNAQCKWIGQINSCTKCSDSCNRKRLNNVCNIECFTSECVYDNGECNMLIPNLKIRLTINAANGKKMSKKSATFLKAQIEASNYLQEKFIDSVFGPTSGATGHFTSWTQAVVVKRESQNIPKVTNAKFNVYHSIHFGINVILDKIKTPQIISVVLESFANDLQVNVADISVDNINYLNGEVSSYIPSTSIQNTNFLSLLESNALNDQSEWRNYRIDYKLTVRSQNEVEKVKKIMISKDYHSSIYEKLCLNLNRPSILRFQIAAPSDASIADVSIRKYVMERNMDISFAKNTITVDELKKKTFELESVIAKSIFGITPNDITIVNFHQASRTKFVISYHIESVYNSTNPLIETVGINLKIKVAAAIGVKEDSIEAVSQSDPYITTYFDAISGNVKARHPNVVHLMLSKQIIKLGNFSMENFNVAIDGSFVAVTNITTRNDYLEIKVSRRIYFGEEIRVGYTMGKKIEHDVRSIDGDILKSFETTNITNNEIRICPLHKRRAEKVCVLCPLGKFRLNQLEDECKFVTEKICPPGTYYSSALAKCASCKEQLGFTDFYTSESESCILHSEKRFHCSNGEYRIYNGSNMDRRQCIPCAAGRFSKSNNNNEVGNACTNHLICPKGTYVKKNTGTLTTERECIACPMGKFNDKLNSALCQLHSECADGFTEAFKPDTKKDRDCVKAKKDIIICDSGSYVKVNSNDGTTRCSLCPAGKFRESPTSSSWCKPWRKCRFNEYEIRAGSRYNDVMCGICNNTGLAWFSGKKSNVQCVSLARVNNNMIVWLALAAFGCFIGIIAFRRFVQRCCCPRQPIDPRDPKGIRKKELAKRPPPPMMPPPLKVDTIPLIEREQRRIVTF